LRGSAGLAIALLVAGASVRAQEPAVRVVLRWQAVPGAAAYELQVASDADFAERELELRVGVAGFRLAPPREGRRYWRVRAVDADGRPGAWSATKIIEPVAPSGQPPAPVPQPEERPLDVPPLTPAPVPGGPAAPHLLEGTPEDSSRPALAAEEQRPWSLLPDGAIAGYGVLGVLREGKPGLLIGWRASLLGASAPEVALEGSWRLPWLGARWRAALRAGWWRDRATVPAGAALTSPVRATADVLPISALLLRRFPAAWAELYAGAGPGLHLVVMRLPGQGALEASGALAAVAGAGRGVGPGELFCELAGVVGGVDGPLGRLRTGGLSVSVGYRLDPGAR
jgi:hypothetical protein